MPDLVADGVVVLAQYRLTNTAGEVLDESQPGEPLVYLHGADNIVPGLEKQLVGKKVGDSVSATVPPEEGYGERTGQSVRVEKTNFPPDVDLQPGMQFVVQQEDGSVAPVFVTEVDADAAYITTDHPLAGETLQFEVTIERLRAPTEDELAHGHPHGPDGTAGHHH